MPGKLVRRKLYILYFVCQLLFGLLQLYKCGKVLQKITTLLHFLQGHMQIGIIANRNRFSFSFPFINLIHCITVHIYDIHVFHPLSFRNFLFVIFFSQFR